MAVDRCGLPTGVISGILDMRNEDSDAKVEVREGLARLE
jgi:hypothetical protein